MPKPTLVEADGILESQAIETMLAGLKQWRSDLQYPESHSDMQACFRALFTVYEIRRRPLPTPLRLKCSTCEGARNLISLKDNVRHLTTCPDCRGRGYVNEL